MLSFFFSILFRSELVGQNLKEICTNKKPGQIIDFRYIAKIHRYIKHFLLFVTLHANKTVQNCVLKQVLTPRREKAIPKKPQIWQDLMFFTTTDHFLNSTFHYILKKASIFFFLGSFINQSCD